MREIARSGRASDGSRGASFRHDSFIGQPRRNPRRSPMNIAKSSLLCARALSGCVDDVETVDTVESFATIVDPTVTVDVAPPFGTFAGRAYTYVEATTRGRVA